MSRLRLFWVLARLSALAYGQREMTVSQLVSFIKSSVQLHTPDRQVADYVHKLKLTNKLDDQTVEELQGLGAGARTVAALRELTDSTAKLAAAPPPPPVSAPVAIAPPNSIEQKRILAELAEYARNYTKTLPNFICTQVTRKHVDPTGTESWISDGTVQEHLSYLNGEEDYKVVMVNDRPVSNIGHLQVGGNKSSGEFGTMLAEIFDPDSHTDFEWDHWATLRGRRNYVFFFRVQQGFSKYSIKDEQSGRTIVPGYHGLVYADRDTGMVMRLTLECDNIPASFPVQQAGEVLDYDFQKIADREFVLPLKADMRTRAGRIMAWNEIEFRLYRKFGTETSITFDTPDPIPPDKLKEEPVTPDGK
jgi:hypothetical protein